MRLLPSIALLPRRNITIRHVAFVLAFSAVLWTIHHTYSKVTEAFSPQEHVSFWPPDSPEIWADRAAQVKNAFLHAYHGYERYAFPHDELRPISNTSIDNFNGWGVTVVDSLDTMLLMGLEDEYARAIPIVTATNFSLPVNTNVPFFETVIRYLGGLLSAYALSMDTILREKADELATKLSPAFNTSSGFPRFAVDTYNSSGNLKPQVTPGVLAEIASFQLEYAYLGKITGKKEHVDRVTTVTNVFDDADLNLSGGMYPAIWRIHDGKPSIFRLSVGGAADSAHEYTLKQFLLTARSDSANLEMYLRFTTHVINNLLYISSQRELLYVTDSTIHMNQTATSHSFEHLSCFFPGLLALGAHLLPLNNLETIGINITQLGDDLPPKYRQGYEALADFDLADLHIWAAEGIAQMCYLSYADQPSGLGPDTVSMRIDQSGEIRWMDEMRRWKASGQIGPPPGVGDKRPWVGNPKAKAVWEKQIDTITRDYTIKNTAYYLRPEAVESFYILWRTTGDVKWRHRGWSVFQAIERTAKTPSGYANVDRVHSAAPILIDSMPSYFLAETLKYLYLLFLDDDIVPLDKWVFNTEAHPLPVFAWTESEKEIFSVK
ncbi:glycoside hydrolase family 47 protein [Boletus reticuloceps]|uniref:alpha-1,2-Mannosidase n=1 Tax=Boletus reticuloceps TaxID=495285 RepID=A0A8I2YN13_9AGAM|nr:glycoside hydrolase family 47 protein [Boletus reticuloceps]